MESSPLTKAHDHARAAAIATQASDTTVAINEHAQAAGEFANASKTTNSYEALRTLRLLEQHHKRLSELLKLPRGPPSQTGPDDIPEEDEKEEREEGDHKAVTPREDQLPTKKKTSAKPPPTLSSHSRYPGRNLSSSIASNLASARGIRASYSTQPLPPSISNDQAPGSLEARPRREGSSKGKPPNPSWVPPVTKEDSVIEPPKPEPTSPTPSEDGFSRFYSTFGSLINRLSAPLAFTGLPLVPEESTPAPTPPPAEQPQRKLRHKTSTSSAEPDLSKIYSRATLRSLERDGHGAADSFYVVPTSGHTASYASVLNHENKEKRRLAASMHRGGGGGADENDDNEDEDDFVDARESQAPMSPTFRRLLARARSDKDLRNIVEELYTENSTLKDVLDKVSKRLHNFELNSQSSHLALAQSLRLQRPTSPISSSGLGLAAGVAGAGAGAGASAGEEALRKRNRELEEQMSEMVQRMNSLEKDHLKLQVTLEKYRDRWEKLKAGAKARRSAQDLVYDGESRR